MNLGKLMRSLKEDYLAREILCPTLFRVAGTCIVVENLKFMAEFHLQLFDLEIIYYSSCNIAPDGIMLWKI